MAYDAVEVCYGGILYMPAKPYEVVTFIAGCPVSDLQPLIGAASSPGAVAVCTGAAAFKLAVDVILQPRGTEGSETVIRIDHMGMAGGAVRLAAVRTRR